MRSANILRVEYVRQHIYRLGGRPLWLQASLHTQNHDLVDRELVPNGSLTQVANITSEKYVFRNSRIEEP